MRPVASRKHTDAMDYLDNMEMLDSGIMDTVLGETSAYDPGSFSERDVMDALEGECGIDGFAALLSPAAEPHLEEMAVRVQLLLERVRVLRVQLQEPHQQGRA